MNETHTRETSVVVFVFVKSYIHFDRNILGVSEACKVTVPGQMLSCYVSNIRFCNPIIQHT